MHRYYSHPYLAKVAIALLCLFSQLRAQTLFITQYYKAIAYTNRMLCTHVCSVSLISVSLALKHLVADYKRKRVKSVAVALHV